MKTTLTSVLLISALSALGQTATFHDHTAVTILGDTISMDQYFGKKVMVVNTASFCGFTPQFTELQHMYELYASNNFEIIGFPCNDFSNQDPNSDSVIHDFCTDNYGVTFQMMSKVQVVTGDTSDVYKWLQRANLNGVADVSVNWNFNKFLIDEAGHWVNHFVSTVLPNDTAIVNWILSPSVLSVATTPSNPEPVISRTEDSIGLLLQPTKPQHHVVELFTIDGRSMGLTFNSIASPGTRINIPLTGFAGGLYVLSVTTSAGRKTWKVPVLAN